MFTIMVQDNGEIHVSGRLDASQVETAEGVLDQISVTTYVDMKGLDYISSAGLGVLLKTQQRLKRSGHSLILRNMNKMVRDIFKIARFDMVFRIEEGGT